MEVAELDLSRQLLDIARGDRRRAAVAAAFVVSELGPRIPSNLRLVDAVACWGRTEVEISAVHAARAALETPSPMIVALALVPEVPEAELASALEQLGTWCALAAWARQPEGATWLRAHPGVKLESLSQHEVAARAIEVERAQLGGKLRAWRERDQPAPRGTPLVMAIDHDRLRVRPERKSPGDRALIAAVGSHVEATFGVAPSVVHDTDQRWVHLDVFFASTSSRLVLVTCGMAEQPLSSVDPKRAEEPVFTELVMELPPDWPHTDDALREPRTNWPLAWLRALGRGPHRTGTAYEARHTVGPIDAEGANAFGGALFLASRHVPRLSLADRTVTFLAVCPLHASELRFARERGVAALLERLLACSIDLERVDPTRAAVV